MELAEAVESVRTAAIGSRAVALIRAAREFRDLDDRRQLRIAAHHAGLSRSEINASLAVADRGANGS